MTVEIEPTDCPVDVVDHKLCSFLFGDVTPDSERIGLRHVRRDFAVVSLAQYTPGLAAGNDVDAADHAALAVVAVEGSYPGLQRRCAWFRAALLAHVRERVEDETNQAADERAVDAHELEVTSNGELETA
jgi:hypothetical protein